MAAASTYGSHTVRRTDLNPSLIQHHKKRQRPTPPAPGHGNKYQLPQLPMQVCIPFNFSSEFEAEENFLPQLGTLGHTDVLSNPSRPSSPQASTASGETTSSQNGPEDVAADSLILPQPRPLKRQRSGSYPPPAKRPGNLNDWSRRDHSELRHLGERQNPAELNQIRPRRERKPPKHLTYDEKGQQIIIRTKRSDL